MTGRWGISAQTLQLVLKKLDSKKPHYSSYIKKKAGNTLLERFLERFEHWLCVACLYCAFITGKPKFGPCQAFRITGGYA